MMEWPWLCLAHSQAKLEKETREELATLEAKNRSLSHQLVLLQQEDEAQAGYIRLHRATAAPVTEKRIKKKACTEHLLRKSEIMKLWDATLIYADANVI